MINFTQIPRKQKPCLYGIISFLFSTLSFGQVTETYTIQTGNFDATHTTNTNSNYLNSYFYFNLYTTCYHK